METTRDISSLFDDPTYSDLVVVANDRKWHCHKCIVFTISERLHDFCRTSFKAGGKDEICLTDYGAPSIERMLRFMYGSSEADLFDDHSPHVYIGITTVAYEFGLPELLEMGISGLRQALEQEKNAKQLVYYIDWMRHPYIDEIDELLDLADEVEFERMHEMLEDDEARSDTRSATIKAYFDRVLITKKKGVTPGRPLGPDE
ncbi:unnamed protein product [Zymoseptoria tritici ST99CH_3D7]|uniref:BTB domain-containing protein n=1 Tax=Zymoseptoria tritici (strain ST99CH_3D7) TaxID=1276538 RepID=A0A1X7S5J7_ZYMT9|nr:unnamed protein product [Zymoseptoria tritici ST99CH_3D7]